MGNPRRKKITPKCGSYSLIHKGEENNLQKVEGEKNLGGRERSILRNPST